jgi:hypothetical protein
MMNDASFRLPMLKDHTAMNTILAAMRRVLVAFGILMLGLYMPAAAAGAGKPETFASPERAVEALVAASRNNDSTAMLKLFGAAGRDLVSSGDPVADADMRARFVERYGVSHKILKDTANRATLIVGTEEWPFPIPLARHRGVWLFDTAAGEQEIIDRRVGRNELNAMEVCRSYVQAQRDYAAGFATPEYAQKIFSSPGLHDGLYWPAGPGEKQSPLGPQMAHARAEGYGIGDSANEPPQPYHGYFYKTLTRQGPAAPGGARDYIANGHMTGGFALIAFPAKYGDSGIMTFIVSQNGIVYQKNLGRDTATRAAAIAEFNPDMSWKTR